MGDAGGLAVALVCVPCNHDKISPEILCMSLSLSLKVLCAFSLKVKML